MGFYIRKSIRIRGLRLNLSKRGVGVSAGVKGLRVGVKAGGSTYVSAGKDGLYYRKTLTRGHAKHGPAKAHVPAETQPAVLAATRPPTPVTTTIVRIGLIALVVVLATIAQATQH